MRFVFDTTITLRDVEHVDRLADMVMDATSALDAVDVIHVVIGADDEPKWFDVETRGIGSRVVSEAHTDVCRAVGRALQEFWNQECGVAA